VPKASDSAASSAGRQILLIALVLVGLGVVMVYSSSSVLASTRFHSSGFFLKRQLVRAAIGVFIMLAASMVPVRAWRRLARPLLLVGFGLLVLVLVAGVGRGVQRWLPISIPLVRVGLSFQPSEFVKLILVLYLADVMVRKGEVMGEWSVGLLPRVAVIGAAQILIILQPDLGTALAIGAIALTMLWLGGAGTLHVAMVGLVAIPVAIVSVLRSPYQLERLTSFLQGGDPQGSSFQRMQSLLALGSGGPLGVGLGNSMQKYYLPEPHTDFVFAFVGEELGLAGTLSVIALFVALAIHGLRIARHATTDHGFLVAAGITTMIAVYAVLNMGVATGLLPTTGLPLPFVSYGGSSLVWNLAGVGILAAVARDDGQVSPATAAPRDGAVAREPLTRQVVRRRGTRDLAAAAARSQHRPGTGLVGRLLRRGARA